MALKKVELSLQLVSNSQIHKINLQWRKKDKPTDVLSFPQYSIKQLRELDKQARAGLLGVWAIGDIVISRAKTREQAADKGLTYAQELEILLVHGLLHLLGFDHEISEREARRMRRLERLLLKK